MQILLSTQDIGFELPERTLFNALTLSIARGDRIGLIGRNGAGKSTLLKILARMVRPNRGRVELFGKVRYLPQLDFSLFNSAQTIQSFVESQEAEWALVRASLERLFGKTAITPDADVRTLSGGEIAKLLIAIADVDHPDILFLDEPTNHLDIVGLEVLNQYLFSFSGASVVVSHDPLFLEHVATSIWEIDHGTVTRFGGTYSSYQEQKRLADQARTRHLEAARKNVAKARRAIEVRETREARAARVSRQAKHEPSRDKFAEGYFKDLSEHGSGRLKRQQDKVMEERELSVQQLRNPKRKTVHLDLYGHDDNSKRMLVSLSQGYLCIGERQLLRDIDTRVQFGNRIVITGKNGSGKSSLAKALIGMQGPGVLTGTIKRSDALDAAYLDQKYETVMPQLSVLGNVLISNPSLTESDARAQLGKFLFGTDISVTTPARMLSGGETARLALAQVTSRPIDLLVLDEPTNNVDIETLEIIADSLADFPGALIVISHNVHFLARLRVDRAYVVSDGHLKEMSLLPEHEEEFYRELVESE